MPPRSPLRWHRRRSDGTEPWQIIDDQGRVIATGIIDEDAARLMAEAPNLLEALRAVLQPGTAFAISLALYAIDRAEGRPGV